MRKQMKKILSVSNEVKAMVWSREIQVENGEKIQPMIAAANKHRWFPPTATDLFNMCWSYRFLCSEKIENSRKVEILMFACLCNKYVKVLTEKRKYCENWKCAYWNRKHLIAVYFRKVPSRQCVAKKTLKLYYFVSEI